MLSRKRRRAATIAAFLIIICLTLWHSHRPALSYRVTDLGVLPGYNESDARVVNSRGIVLVTSGSAVLPLRREALYRGGRLFDIGTLPGASEVHAWGLNAPGDVTGTATIGGVPHAFLYHTGKMRDLGTLPGFPNSEGRGINDTGEIAGNLINDDAPPGQAQSHVFVVRRGKMTDLGIPPGCRTIEAWSINASGLIFGECRQISALSGKYKQQPFVCDSRTGEITVFAVTAPYTDGHFDQGNASGESVGSVFDSTGHAALWNGTKITDMGTLPGYTGDYGRGLNNRGQAVGYCFRDEKMSIVQSFLHNILHFPERDRECAFLYQEGEMQDLNELIPGDADWKLEEAWSINDTGQIVGAGLHHGNRRAFLLTPVR